MKSSSFFVIIIGAILGYLGYKYYYLPKTQTSNQTTTQTSSISAPIITTASKSLQNGKSTISQGIASGLISSSKVSSLTNTQLKTTEIGCETVVVE